MNNHKNIRIDFSDGKYVDILKDKRNWPYLGLTLVRKTTNNIKIGIIKRTIVYCVVKSKTAVY